MKIGKTTVDIVIRYSVEHATYTENMEDIQVITNDPYGITPCMVVGIVEAAKTVMINEGIEIYTTREDTNEEDNNRS